MLAPPQDLLTSSVRQFYLTALAGEEAMLATFASRLPPDAIFVSYNGRSCDAHAKCPRCMNPGER